MYYVFMNTKIDLQNGFLPVSKKDMEKSGINVLDFVFITGDAYVDHPSFATALLSRVLVSRGYSVGIISQPDWHSCDDFKRLGRPRLGFLVSAGNIDSMVNHYTVAKKRRNTDFYSPGGEAGHRPDRATIVYCNRIREAYGRDIPIIIGGIEASLRRFAHYDYWTDKVRRSILIDSGADLLVFGMGEHQTIEIADLLDAGVSVNDIKSVNGTMYLEKDKNLLPSNGIELPDYNDVSTDKTAYATATAMEYKEQDAVSGKPLYQLDRDLYTVQNPPSSPLTTEELDKVYELPYMRTYHPMYEKQGGIPAISEVKFSLTSCRGCFGSCNFCALTFHQGRTVTSRSHASLLREAELLTKLPDFKGYVHDIGGPTANFRQTSCEKQKTMGLCKGKKCLAPKVCPALKANHEEYIDILRSVRKIKGVKKVFIRSGIRFDYIMYDKNEAFFKRLVSHHVSGQLKVAPEHTSDVVLQKMRKPSFRLFHDFKSLFDKINKREGLRQQLIPYFISSHPGCTEEAMAELAVTTKYLNFHLEQVQDFTPTPMTLATEMYYTGIDPYTGEKVFTARTQEQKLGQRKYFFWYQRESEEDIRNSLTRMHRADLIRQLYGDRPFTHMRNNAPRRESALPPRNNKKRKK